MSDLALTVPLDGVRLIEASAGTGKTWTLAGLYARLVVERGLAVRQIAVVTFTEAATEELRARLRERLALCAAIACDAAAFIGDDSPDIVQCSALIAAARAREPAEALRRRLRLAALSLDEAPISTIHGFCRRVLREHGLAAGVGAFDGELIENENELVLQLARDLWREAAVGPDTLAFSALREIAGNAGNFIEMLSKLRHSYLVLEPEAPAAIPALQERIVATEMAQRKLADAYAICGPDCFNALIAHIEAGNVDRRTYPTARVVAEAAQISAALASGGRIATALLARYSHAELEIKRSKNGISLPPQPFFAAVEAMLAVERDAARARLELGLVLLHEAVAALRMRLAEWKRRADRYGHDDLVARMQAALHSVRGAGLARTVAAQFPALLVDECQDSDPHQFDIFFALRASGAEALFLIGDPKQAIYRFRGGDVEAYLRARDRADGRYSLEHNFRATPALLRALERVYAAAGDAAFGDPRIGFVPVAPGGRARDDDLRFGDAPAMPLTFWQLGADATSKGGAMTRLAQGCAAEIVRLLALAASGVAILRDGEDHRPLAPGDLAVLVNKHEEATAMRAALDAAGIPSAAVAKRSVFATTEATELHTLLTALAEFDEPRLRAALATTLLGADAAAIDALRRDTVAWRERLADFSAWREVWERHGVLALVERVLEHCAAALLALGDGERHIARLLHLAELLQCEAARQPGMRALANAFARRIAGADAEYEEEQLRLESDAARVQILTLHKSKGLEFPVVFLPFAPLTRQAANAKLLRCHRDGRQVVYLPAFADDRVRAAAADEALAERLRMLYVGLTRARAACYVAWGDAGSGGEIQALRHLLCGAAADCDPDARLDALAAPGLIAVAPLPEPTTQRWRAPASDALRPARRFDHRLARDWGMHSYSRLRGEGHAGIHAGADDESTDADLVNSDASELPELPGGTRFGTAFHDIMENANFNAWRRFDADDARSAPFALVRRTLERHGLSIVLTPRVAQLARATLRVPLPAGCRLIDLDPSQRRAELEFHFAMGGGDPRQLLDLLHEHGYLRGRAHFAVAAVRLEGLMHGLIDLVFVHDGRWWIVDYKTNQLGRRRADYAPARLAAAVRASEYDLQYLIYLVALHRWLRLQLGVDYDYARDVGGAIYLYARGIDERGEHGVFHDAPPVALIVALDALLAPAAAA